MDSGNADHLILWTNEYSLCSTQTRYALAVRGEVCSGKTPITIEERQLDILENMEQLSEEFLLGVNRKGQVPVLVNSDLFPQALTESVDMAKFFTQRYPSLDAPKPFSQEAETLLEQLHALDFYVLSFAHDTSLAWITVSSCKQRLAQADAPRYREALEYKLKLYQSHKGEVTGSTVAVEESRTLEYLRTIRAVMRRIRDPGPWIYGKHGPTALDAHLVVFLARLRDAGHFDLFDEPLTRYLDAAMSTDAWHKVSQGRHTLPDDIVVKQ